MTEPDLAKHLGIGRPLLAQMRRLKLEEGIHFTRGEKPLRRIEYTGMGVTRMRELLGVPDAEAAKLDGAVHGAQPEPAPQGEQVANLWIPDAMIPNIKANGLILAKGRPGWWTQREAIVKQTAFANRRAILVTYGDRDVICRVKDADKFAVGQVVPVREYGAVLLAARQPRWRGKW